MNIIVLIFGVIGTLVLISKYLINHQFSIMKYSRNIEKSRVTIGEEVQVTMTIENRSNIGIPFLFIKEYLPKDINIVGKEGIATDNVERHYNIYLAINRKERLKRIYNIKANKRGVHPIERVDITIGDQFGLLEKKQKIKDEKELIVYPNYSKLSDVQFLNNSLSGDEIIKRFIFEDPLMVKGIREYTVNHRMKDIHWNSSLKTGRLMVKEYDYTSDREVVIILNVQCGQPSYLNMDNGRIENGISLAMSVAECCIEQGISTSLWTNSSLKGVDTFTSDKTETCASSLEPILEMGARINNWTSKEFPKYLQDNYKNFNSNSLYFVITPFLDEQCEEILSQLYYKGVNIKILDISKDGINSIQNIEILRQVEEAIV